MEKTLYTSFLNYLTEIKNHNNSILLGNIVVWLRATGNYEKAMKDIPGLQFVDSYIQIKKEHK